MTSQHSNHKQLDLTVRSTNVRTSDLTGYDARSDGRTLPPIGGQASVRSSSDVVPSELSDLLDEISNLKHRLNTGVTYCLKRPGTPNAAKGHDRLLRILTREYLPAINALQETYPRQSLESERDELLDRLERGWQMEDSDGVARTFTKLLARYEVLSDALDGDVINRHLERVERALA